MLQLQRRRRGVVVRWRTWPLCDVLMWLKMLCSREIRADMTVGGGVLSKAALGKEKR